MGPAQDTVPERPGAEGGDTMKREFSLTERAVYSAVMAFALSLVLSTSPIWKHLPDVSALLGSTYSALFRALPGSPNTALAFVVLAVATFVFLLLMRHPVVGIAGMTASVLLFAGYPYSHIRWHEVLPFMRFQSRDPGVAEWVLGLLPVVLLLLVPIVLQIRGILARYEEKGLDRRTLRPALRQLIELAVLHGVVAIGFTVLMGVILLGLMPDLKTGSGWLVDNSLIVLLVAGLLVLAGIAIGSGLFSKGDVVAGNDDAEETREA
ncbi:MAG: hypothetical protein KY455_13690 [Euryarchaeota archaeon]|nr:hypothetical protein [Euryarchaeota archaeon]